MLTGPAGTAKTTTIRVLAKELDFDVLEWRNTLEESYQEGDYGSYLRQTNSYHY